MKAAVWFATALILAGAAAAEAEEPVAPGDPTTVATDYCAAIVDEAAAARAAAQAATLHALEAELDAKIAALDARQKDLQGWIARRDEMLKAAGRELVDIYGKMDPESAAAQLPQLDLRTATSILRQLSPRAAGAILDEMDPEPAARLVKAIASAAGNESDGGGS